MAVYKGVCVADLWNQNGELGAGTQGLLDPLMTRSWNKCAVFYLPSNIRGYKLMTRME